MLQQATNGTTRDYQYGWDRLASVTNGTSMWYGTDALGRIPQPFGFMGELREPSGDPGTPWSYV